MDYLIEETWVPSSCRCKWEEHKDAYRLTVRNKTCPDHRCRMFGTVDACEGEVSHRLSSGETCFIWECSKHADESAERLNRLNRNYPDSDTPPHWFDPSYAGESWNDDY
ncbi:hypothetical protein [Nonomuraea recticatena]|uniref:Uncharacterized protein n=1 Tax=Nonomuraea recticatena TaxID=46178 RepID=A0ABP6EHS4_9ACTN